MVKLGKSCFTKTAEAVEPGICPPGLGHCGPKSVRFVHVRLPRNTNFQVFSPTEMLAMMDIFRRKVRLDLSRVSESMTGWSASGSRSTSAKSTHTVKGRPAAAANTSTEHPIPSGSSGWVDGPECSIAAGSHLYVFVKVAQVLLHDQAPKQQDQLACHIGLNVGLVAIASMSYRTTLFHSGYCYSTAPCLTAGRCEYAAS